VTLTYRSGPGMMSEASSHLRMPDLAGVGMVRDLGAQYETEIILGKDLLKVF